MNRRSSRARAVVALASAAAMVAACNAFTGAGDLGVDDDAGGGGPEPDPFALADGVSITGLDVYQTLRTPLMEGGALVVDDDDVPIIAGRQALLRVFYERTDGASDARALTARVHLERGSGDDGTGGAGGDDGDDDEQTENEAAPPIEVAVTLNAATSVLEDLDSTVNVRIPAERLAPDTTFRVELVQAREEVTAQDPDVDNAVASFPLPDAEAAPLPVEEVGPLHLRLVPIRYNADGSGRLPDISEEQIERYRAAFEATYPVPGLVLTVDPIFETDIAAQDFSGFADLLDAITQYRADVNARPWEFFYGIFDPGGTGGIAGLASLGFSDDARVGIGLGGTGPGSVATALHEVGHTHTRPHSPGCGAPGADPEWPRDENEGTIGVWGYDQRTGNLLNPAGPFRDFMSYCGPEWVSDFVYRRLFDVASVANPRDDLGMAKFGAAPRAHRYARYRIHPDGSARRLPDLELSRAARGRARVAVELEVDGERIPVEGTFYPYDHGQGGIVMVPLASRITVTAARFEHIDRTFHIAR
ncbi:MAG: hypothetical protein AAF928_11355 [Myxococcota bacterium]